MKFGLVELEPLLNTFRCKLIYMSFSRNVNLDKSIFPNLKDFKAL